MSAAPGLHVQCVGQGEPTLVFVHGFCCSLDDWALQIDALKVSFRCVALDLPGHGGSALPGTASIAELATAVNAAKRESGARKLILVGHSLGCKVIREAYAQESHDVIGLVFIEGAFYRGDGEAVVRRAREAVDSAGFAAYARRHFSEMFLEGGDPEARARVLARVQAMDPQFARDLYLAAVAWDPARGEQTLRDIQVPVLVLQTTYNDENLQRRPLQPGIRTPFMEAVAALVADAQIKVVPGCGHFVLGDAPEVITRELREFATRIS
jgi:pimeloyl-ACP methyl ester carboxylesterase